MKHLLKIKPSVEMCKDNKRSFNLNILKNNIPSEISDIKYIIIPNIGEFIKLGDMSYFLESRVFEVTTDFYITTLYLIEEESYDDGDEYDGYGYRMFSNL